MSGNLNTEISCPACGTSNKSNNIYCSSCGFRISEPDPNKFEIEDRSRGKALIFFLFGVFFLVILFFFSSNIYGVFIYLIMALLSLGFGFYSLRKSK